jgi:hypothetical protein
MALNSRGVGSAPELARPQSAWLRRPPFSLMLGPPEHQKREQEGPETPESQNHLFRTLFYQLSQGMSSEFGARPSIVLLRFRFCSQARASKKMLPFDCDFSTGNDPCRVANFANDVNQNVPRTTKTELDAGFHSTRSRERKRALKCFQNRPRAL